MGETDGGVSDIIF